MRYISKDEQTAAPAGENYIWVVTKEGSFWRKKRGTVKKAKLNTAFRKSNNSTKICSPAASRIVRKLRPFMHGMRPGRVTVRICGKLRKAYNETGKLDLGCLKDLDMQKEYPFNKLFRGDINVKQTAHEIIVTIPITEFTINGLNRLVTNYYFDLVLLYGNAGKENGLRTESVDSDVYAMEKKNKTNCVLRMVLPEQPWIALLKINSIEGNERAAHAKLYGMKVVGGFES